MEHSADVRMRRWGTAAVVVVAALLGGCLLVAGSVAATPSTASSKGGQWPMFGHDPAHSGVSSDAAIGASSAPSMTQRWSASLGSTSVQASPVVAYSSKLKETLVFDVTYPGTVSAFNAASGGLVWTRSVGADVDSTPAIHRGTLYLGTLSGELEALNASTGAVRCTFTLPVIPPATAPGRLISSPVVKDVDGTGPTVFIGDAGTAESTNGGHLWAIAGVGNSAGACHEKWMYDHWANKGTDGDRTGVWDQPGLAQNSHGEWEVVFGTSNPDQSVYALDAATGAQLWRFQTAIEGPDEDVAAGPTISPPGTNGFAHGVVYIDGKDGVEYALKLLTGREIWSYVLGPGSPAPRAVCEAALSGNTLVTCYASSVFALNATTGAKLWSVEPGSEIYASPAVSGPAGNEVVSLGDLTGTERELELQNGAQVFSAAHGGQIKASTAVAQGMIYFIADGTLYAYAPS